MGAKESQEENKTKIAESKRQNIEKRKLLTELNTLQQNNPELKQAWIDWCEQDLGGILDPAQHDADILDTFLQSWRVDDAAPWREDLHAPLRKKMKKAPADRVDATEM